MRVISDETVLAHADTFTQAACRFRAMASELAARMTRKLNLSLEDFGNINFDRDEAGWNGSLDAEWRYGFHGNECFFHSTMTGAYLEVCLWFGEEFGVLNSYFFLLFLRSIPEYQPLAQLLPNAYHDACRVLDILHQHGRLRTVTGLYGLEGLTASVADW